MRQGSVWRMLLRLISMEVELLNPVCISEPSIIPFLMFTRTLCQQGHVDDCKCLMFLTPACNSNKPTTLLKVFGESCQLRSQLKADIRVQVHNLKSLFLDNGSCQPHPPHEVQASIRERVSSWVSNGSYLHDTVSNSVCVIFSS